MLLFDTYGLPTPKVVRKHTQGVVENIKVICSKCYLFSSSKTIENRLRFDEVNASKIQF